MAGLFRGFSRSRLGSGCNQLVATQPRCLIVQDVHHEYFIGGILGCYSFQRGANRIGISCDNTSARRYCGYGHSLVFEKSQSLFNRRDGNQLASKQKQQHHPGAGGETQRFLGCFRAERPDRHRDARLTERFRRPEVFAIVSRERRALGVNEIGKDIGQPELGRPDRALGR